ncbi:MAG: hypothetical protein ACXVVQ_20455, partial [Solirubrobacteraceae bacterium]
SLALLPLGYALAGPLAEALGARHVLLVGSVLGLGMLGLTLLPRETRELGQGGLASCEEDEAFEPTGKALVDVT